MWNKKCAKKGMKMELTQREELVDIHRKGVAFCFWGTLYYFRQTKGRRE
jgi:hypothetical protein